MNTISNRSILVVHGRDFKPTKEALMDISMAALRAGVERDYPDRADALDSVFKDMAYFGDLNNTVLESQGKRYDAQLDLGDRANALASLRTVQARKRFGIRQYDRLPGKSALHEFAADIAAPVLGAVGLTMPLIGCVSKDCAEYLKNKSNYADEVRERVRTKLCEAFDRGDKILLITHGMGCIVAYDVLWELSHEPALQGKYGEAKIDAWLTLGAPLGFHGTTSLPKTITPVTTIRWPTTSRE